MKTPEPSPNLAAERPRSRWRVARVRVRLFCRSLRPPWSWATRGAFLFAGVVLPIACFAIGFPMGPDWQSGALSDYAQLLMSHRPASAMYPLLLYSMTCLTLLVVAPRRYVRRFVVRLGVYTGVLLAVQYWLLFAAAMAGTNAGLMSSVSGMVFVSALAVPVPWGVGWVCLWLFRRYGTIILWPGAVLVMVVTLTVGPAIVAYALLCSTPWAVACYGAMAVVAFRNSGRKRLQYSLAELLGVSTWLAAFFAAWRTSVLWMLEGYSKLPTTPPDNCYVCTAAARGHRRFVGAEDCATASGGLYRANDQMRWLKAAELLLAARWPRVHRACRRVYDRLGPRLAARLGHPLAADAAYLTLKPAEWLTRAVFAALLPGRADVIRGLYRKRGQNDFPADERHVAPQITLPPLATRATRDTGAI